MLNDPAAYAAIDAATAPSFSADGRTLFYLRGAGLAQIWVLDLDSLESRKLTRRDEKLATFRRAPGDNRLLYGMDAGGDERQQIWLLDGFTATSLTDAPEVIHALGAWHKDGTRFSLGANASDPASFDILIQDIGSGARTLLHRFPHEVTPGPWHKDGTRLLVIEECATQDQRPAILGLDGAVHAIPRAGPARYASLRWDGDGLIGLTDTGRDLMALCRIDPATGAATPVYAPESVEVEAWALSPDGALLATVENDRGYGVLRVGPVDGARPRVAGLAEGVTAELAWSPDSTRLAFAHSTPTSPSALFLWEGGAARPVFAPDCTLAVAPFHLVEWTSFDKRAVPGWLALPPGETPNGGHPAVIWVHGGPANQARADFRPNMQALLAAGYAVLMPNARGSSGYGRAALAADDVEKRLDSVHDLAAARHFLARQPGIDPHRIAVMGQSYGGYMVMAALTEFPDLWRAGVNLYGIADFGTLLAGTGPWRRTHRSAEYGDPARHRALFDRISPIRHINRVGVPLLVLHGTRDPRVPIGESEQIVAALRGLGRPVQYEVFDYAGHGFIRPDDKRRLFRATTAFLDAHLRG